MHICTTFYSGKKAEVKGGRSCLSALPTPLMLPISLPTTLVTNTTRKDTRHEKQNKLIASKIGKRFTGWSYLLRRTVAKKFVFIISLTHP